MLAASRYFLYSSRRTHQLLPRVFQFVLHLVAPRQDLLRLDLDQQTGHRQEIAHRVDVQLLEHRQILEILVGDRRDGNVGDLDLVLAHQVEQEVHRAPEQIQVNAKVDHGRGKQMGWWW